MPARHFQEVEVAFAVDDASQLPNPKRRYFLRKAALVPGSLPEYECKAFPQMFETFSLLDLSDKQALIHYENEERKKRILFCAECRDFAFLVRISLYQSPHCRDHQRIQTEHYCHSHR